MTRKKSSKYPLRANEETWERVRSAAEIRGAPISVVLDRLLTWFVDQPEEKKAEIMGYGVQPRMPKKQLKIGTITPKGIHRRDIEE